MCHERYKAVYVIPDPRLRSHYRFSMNRDGRYRLIGRMHRLWELGYGCRSAMLLRKSIVAGPGRFGHWSNIAGYDYQGFDAATNCQSTLRGSKHPGRRPLLPDPHRDVVEIGSASFQNRK